jgi:hypothetical protein
MELHRHYRARLLEARSRLGAEMALAHPISSGVEAAYRRGDLFEKARQLMQDWAGYCSKPDTANGGVVLLRQGV